MAVAVAVADDDAVSVSVTITVPVTDMVGDKVAPVVCVIVPSGVAVIVWSWLLDCVLAEDNDGVEIDD